MKKRIIIDERAKRELERFLRTVQVKFRALFRVLETTGVIDAPFGKKLAGQKGLFEMRIKFQGQ